MLQKYLSTVLEHSEIEVQDHQISERIWNKEKSQLQEQIRILQGKVATLPIMLCRLKLLVVTNLKQVIQNWKSPSFA